MTTLATTVLRCYFSCCPAIRQLHKVLFLSMIVGVVLTEIQMGITLYTTTTTTTTSSSTVLLSKNQQELQEHDFIRPPLTTTTKTKIKKKSKKKNTTTTMTVAFGENSTITKKGATNTYETMTLSSTNTKTDPLPPPHSSSSPSSSSSSSSSLYNRSYSLSDWNDKKYQVLVQKLARSWWNWPLVSSNNNNINSSSTNNTTQHTQYDYDYWCVPKRPGGHSKRLWNIPGMHYVKIPKTASSTTAGLTIRIAKAVGKRKLLPLQQQYEYDQEHGIITTTNSSIIWPKKIVPGTCDYEIQHGDWFVKRSHPYFLFSMLRQPISRIVSQYYAWTVSRGLVPNTTTSEQQLQIFLQHPDHAGYQFRYLWPIDKETYIRTHNMEPPPLPYNAYEELWNAILPNEEEEEGNEEKEDSTILNNNNNLLLDHVKLLLNTYQFIGLIERRAESNVILQLLLGLQEEDLIVLSSKSTGSYTDAHVSGKCVYLQSKPKQYEDNTTTYLLEQGPLTHPTTNIDVLLYDVLNASLDLTIDTIKASSHESHINFDQMVQRHLYLQQIADTECHDQAKWPCSDTGQIQIRQARKSCYWADVGCGYQCVDYVLKELQQKEKEEKEQEERTRKDKKKSKTKVGI